MNRRGILSGVAAYALWGLLPVFWKTLHGVPALEILCHRSAWSFVFVLLVLTVKRHWQWLRPALHDRRILLTFAATSALLSANWFTYIWAVNAGYIVDASLGYFINPLVNVALGGIFLGERPRRWQVVAIAIAAVAVGWLTFSHGSIPWIALTLAFTFGFYGLLRKTAPLASLAGFSLEAAIMLFPATAYLLILEWHGAGTFGHAGPGLNLLLPLAGLVTALPLLWFAHAAQRITLTTLGLIQYIAPTLQFLLGVLIYGESLTPARLLAFAAIWIALFIYTFDSILQARRGNLRYSPIAG